MLELLTALLTPLIAIVSAYVAYQQYRIRRDERQLVIYDRRLAIFKSSMSILDRIHAGHTVKTAEVIEWYSSVAEAQFLFGNEVFALLDELYSRVFSYAIASETYEYLSIQVAGEALLVEEVRTPLMRVLTPYLRPAGSPNGRMRRLSTGEALALLPSPKRIPPVGDSEIPF
ncbi:MAG: hypothetical protein Q7U09_16375 [Hydrogenophaga sp.]|uniref:hypothetical protein n=1 Tax=Hydrogenophaga sp. TaxID=1904254 RepID=UPI0027214461|nr:hypothetical protein [Hydrogenophaga sp.]MDO9293159.1 hypothetical protein [Hydrogenophaga sp.]MDZ4280969.1 hypothetical protein [Hydrogenophaga sp.]